MKPEAKDLQLTPKTKTSLKIQDLNFVWEELEDEAAATIQGGVWYFSDSTTPRPFTVAELYKLGGFWGG